MLKLKNSQTKRVLEYMSKGYTLTSKQAFDKWGITRLSAIIFNLRKNGYDISTIIVRGQNRYGEAVHWGVYKLNRKYQKGNIRKYETNVD